MTLTWKINSTTHPLTLVFLRFELGLLVWDRSLWFHLVEKHIQRKGAHKGISLRTTRKSDLLQPLMIP